MKSGIYEIRLCGTERCYVGSAVDIQARWRVHRYALRKGRHHSSKLQNAWNKYGENSFSFIAIFTCAKEHLLEFEQVFLNEYDSASRSSFNCNRVAGNSLGYRHSMETIEKIKRIRTGMKINRTVKHTAEQMEKLHNGRRAWTPNDAYRAKLRSARVGRKPSLGMIHTPESRLSMSVKRREIWKNMSPERRSAIIAARVGKKRSPETRAKISSAVSRAISLRKAAIASAQISLDI